MPKGKLIPSSLNHTANRQHRVPCSDCPWRRDSYSGWLGGMQPQDLIAMAHGEDRYECHVIVNNECVGMAVYRANVCKTLRDPARMRMPKNYTLVFRTPFEFIEHHSK